MAPEHHSRNDHPGVARVLAVLHEAGLDPTVRHLPDAVRTAQAAADALGITPDRIANSLIFRAVDDTGLEHPVLVLASGGHRVDTDKVAAATGWAIGRADADFVRSRTGFVIGGVAPVGHLQPVATFVDTALAAYDTVWAAAGHSHSVFETTYAELVTLTGGTPLDVV